MQIRIDKDEWYPVFFISDMDGWGVTAEISPSDKERYDKAFSDFSAVQKELKSLHDSVVTKAS